MARNYIIGIDLGTTSAKCVIYDNEGNVAAEASKEMEIAYPGAGMAEQNAEDFYTYSCGLIRKCLSDSGIDKAAVAAVGIDSQMGGILPIDRNYSPATYYDTPLDSRSGEENTWMHAEYGDLIIEKNGSMSTFGNKILYWKKQPEWNTIHKFIQPSGYVAGKLAGLSADEAFMDETFICFSGFADLGSCTWSEELCAAMNVDMEKLPRIVKATDIIGEISKQGSEDTGLPKSIPVAAGCGDQIAGFTGAGILESGQMIDVSGTACILGLKTDRYKYDSKQKTLACAKAAIGSGYYLLSVVLGGRTHNWYIDQFCNADKIEAEKQGISVYEFLDEKARSLPPGSDGLVSINYLQGRFFPPEPSVRGLFIGHSWAHTRYHFYRSILESIAYDHYLTKEIMLGLVPETDVRSVTAIGSGANSRFWMQIKADVMTQRYQSLLRSDFATLGAALTAGRAVGLFTDICGITEKFCKPKEIVEPGEGSFEEYRKYIEIYRSLFPALRETYRSLSVNEDGEKNT